MTIHQDSPQLVRHAHMSLTTRLMREGVLVDPLGTASVFLRHFDVKMGTPEQAPMADGWVDGRTLWISPGLVSGWLGKHKVMRERRINGWMRLTENAQAFIVQLMATAMRGRVLSETDLFGLAQAIAKTPLGPRVNQEMKKLYNIDVLTTPSFYMMGEPGAALNTLKAQDPKAWDDTWKGLFEPAWDALGWGGTMDQRKLPEGFPERDVSMVDRARLIAFSLSEPHIPNLRGYKVDPVQMVVEGFTQAIAPLVGTQPPAAPFLFENRAHSYRKAIEDAADGYHPPKVFTEDGKLKPNARFGCVMAAIDLLEKSGVDTASYEEALVGGLSNLDRQE